MVTDINYTYCGDQFTLYTNVKSSCCTPETSARFYLNYTSIKSDLHIQTAMYIGLAKMVLWVFP